ncbi:MAG: hypothetical protein R6U37_04330 [Dehalococcoidia bacterium]
MNWKGMRMHLADPKLCDFSVPKEFYEFHLPSPPPRSQSSVVSLQSSVPPDP